MGHPVWWDAEEVLRAKSRFPGGNDRQKGRGNSGSFALLRMTMVSR